MSVKEELMKLLDEAIAANDSDMIKFVRNRLKSTVHTNENIQETESVIITSPNPAKRKNNRVIDLDQFKMGGRDDTKKKNKIPVNQIKRDRPIWVDDGTLDRVEDNPALATPEFTPVPRNRKPSSMINVVCQKCSGEFKIPEKLSKESYTCDNCILSLKKKGHYHE